MTVHRAPDHQPLYHLALAHEWAAAREHGAYERSTIGLSRAEVGFIHLSFAAQVQGTADRYYGGADDVVLLKISPTLLDPAAAEVKVEPVGDDRYPHLYGPLPVHAVVEVRPLERGDDGRWRTGF
jgi:uncharacterized protein (DUF952 family)